MKDNMSNSINNFREAFSQFFSGIFRRQILKHFFDYYFNLFAIQLYYLSFTLKYLIEWFSFTKYLRGWVRNAGSFKPWNLLCNLSVRAGAFHIIHTR